MGYNWQEKLHGRQQFDCRHPTSRSTYWHGYVLRPKRIPRARAGCERQLSLISFFVSICQKKSHLFLGCGPEVWNKLSQTITDQAYLDALGMEKIENLLRQRSVGAWFLDHLDNPLEANLPLFPPNIEARPGKLYD